MDNIQLTQPSLTYLEPPLLMRNAAGKFEDVSSTSGEIFSRPLAARGAAFGDLDNDGWIDIVINCNNGSPVILRNRGGNANHWLTIDAAGVTGTRVRIVGEDGREQRAILNTTGSYLSANDPRVHFGLGAAATAKLVEVEWPNGVVTRRENVPANQILPISPPLRP